MRAFTLSILVLLLAGSCRSILRTRSSADSTATRSQESSERFTREIIREYAPGRIDTVYTHTTSTIEVPKIITVPQPQLVREIIKETGEKQQAQTEEKQVATQEKQVEKSPMPWWAWLLIGAGIVMSLVFIAGFIYLVVKVRNLPATIVTKTLS